MTIKQLSELRVFNLNHLNYTALDITLDKKGNTEASIKINMKEEDYQPKIEEKVKEYRKKANLKGFRPGKVPASIIKKMYGKAIKVEEINQLLSESLPRYIQENDIKVVGEPLPDMEASKDIDWDNQADFEFVYDIGFVNDFTYELSDKVKVEKYNIKVSDKEVDETIENLRKQFSTNEQVEKSENKEDVLEGRLVQESSGIENETTIDLNRYDEDKIKKFIGVSKGETITFDIRELFPEDTEVSLLVGKKPEEVADIAGEFQFTVQEIQRKAPAEINQDFFNQVFGEGEVNSEEEFKQKVRETIKENYDRESENLLLRDLRDFYVENTEIEVPGDFLKRWLLVKYEGEVTEEQVEEEFESYIKELKWSLISNKIAEEREIKVEHEDVKAKARETIENQLGQSGLLQQLGDNLDPFVDNYLKGDNGNNYMNVFNEARSEKILDTIRENVSIEEQEVTVDEFKDKIDKK